MTKRIRTVSGHLYCQVIIITSRKNTANKKKLKKEQYKILCLRTGAYRKFSHLFNIRMWVSICQWVPYIFICNKCIGWSESLVWIVIRILEEQYNDIKHVLVFVYWLTFKNRSLCTPSFTLTKMMQCYVQCDILRSCALVMVAKAAETTSLKC